ncbi:hypothetical protein Tco_0506964, partial [Tanacetum coccineum]
NMKQTEEKMEMTAMIQELAAEGQSELLMSALKVTF